MHIIVKWKLTSEAIAVCRKCLHRTSTLVLHGMDGQERCASVLLIPHTQSSRFTQNRSAPRPTSKARILMKTLLIQQRHSILVISLLGMFWYDSFELGAFGF